MPNRLADESSPYLVQHADNPVDWHPWGEEAFRAAREADRAIFLSIGYSACHWCHVMAHESFEDPHVAELLNRHFVNVKVDREERPEVDQIYMDAVQAMTGRGGWPLSVFLTPDGEPFYGGTYFPPRARMGMPGFDEILLAVAEAWRTRRSEIASQARRLTEAVRNADIFTSVGEAETVDERLLNTAAGALHQAFDPKYGGFGSAPKFPHPIALRLLLRRWRAGDAELLSVVTTTLEKMAGGGIYDHLGGGFHRYSVDAKWLVPHFEKMLYDNAQLAQCYTEAWQATGRDDFARVARETLDYLLRDMTDPAGGFYSTEDADSEGEEGKFYVWTAAEIDDVLGTERAATFKQVYGVTEEGNFEGKNILNLGRPLACAARRLGRDVAELAAELAESRRRLLEVRQRRVRPGCDDKVLVSWNGLAIEAFARAGAALEEPRYRQAAVKAARFLLSELRGPDGRLLHSWRQGQARFDACLDDYAALAGALVTLYETQFEPQWIEEAVALADDLLSRFSDPDHGGFYYVASDHEPLIARKKDVLDGSVPSGSGLAATTLLRLGRLCGRNDYLAAAEETVQSAAVAMERYPSATGQLLLGLEMYLGPVPQIVILGGEDQTASHEVLADLQRRFLPSKVVAYHDARGTTRPSPALAALFDGKVPCRPGPAVFVCHDFACGAPICGKDAAIAAFADLEVGSER